MKTQIDTNGVLTQSGAVTRVQYGYEEPTVETTDTAATQNSYRVSNGVTKLSMSDFEPSTTGVTKYSMGQDAPLNQGSIMATLRRDGRGSSVELIPGNPSSRTKLETAVRDGLVREISKGIYVDAQATQLQPMQPQQQPAKEAEAATDTPQESIFNKADMAAWNEDLEPIPQTSFDSAVAGTLAAITAQDRGRLDHVASSLAESAGMEPELAREYVNSGIQFYTETVARDLMKNMGMTKAQAYAMFNELGTKGHPKLTQAMQEVAHQGRSDTFRELARQFKAKSVTKGQAKVFQDAGFDTTTDARTGDLMVRRGKGAWVPAREL